MNTNKRSKRKTKEVKVKTPWEKLYEQMAKKLAAADKRRHGS
jgi:hypothetical protein